MPDDDGRMTKDDRPRTLWSEGGEYAGLGLQLAASIGLFLWLGWLGDGWLGTTPLLTIVGAFVGAGGGFYSLYRHVVQNGRDDEASGR